MVAQLAGCATKNESGVVLHKKPDLTKVTPGTPISKVAGLKKPIKREVITKGELKGAQAWLYEWDAPNDEVNNKMFTSVVVKDGIITGFYEETPEKWRKDPGMLKQAKLQSAFEDLASSMAQAAQYQAAAGYLAGYGAQVANRAASAPMEAYNNAYASSYKPWENASTPIDYGAFSQKPQTLTQQRAAQTPSQIMPTDPRSGLQDMSRFASGVIQGDKVYSTDPRSGLRDMSRPASGVVRDGKIYPTDPSSGLQDVWRPAVGVISGGRVYPTDPKTGLIDVTRPAIGVMQ